MTETTVVEVLDRYETRLQAHTYHPASHADQQLQHVLTMIPKMREMLRVIDACLEYSASPVEDAAPWRDKVMRWLGFVQGVLWHADFYTLDELKGHSHPDDASSEAP